MYPAQTTRASESHYHRESVEEYHQFRRRSHVLDEINDALITGNRYQSQQFLPKPEPPPDKDVAIRMWLTFWISDELCVHNREAAVWSYSGFSEVLCLEKYSTTAVLLVASRQDDSCVG